MLGGGHLRSVPRDDTQKEVGARYWCTGASECFLLQYLLSRLVNDD